MSPNHKVVKKLECRRIAHVGGFLVSSSPSTNSERVKFTARQCTLSKQAILSG